MLPGLHKAQAKTPASVGALGKVTPATTPTSQHSHIKSQFLPTNTEMLVALFQVAREFVTHNFLLGKTGLFLVTTAVVALLQFG